MEKLRVGDVVYITGLVVTARDQTHRKLMGLIESGGRPPISLEGLAVYHCGPVVLKEGDSWRVIAAGPTTSYRMGMLVPRLVELTGAKLVIGKGGLPDDAAEALSRVGGVYLAYPGGAGALAANRIRRVIAVYWLEELGMPEAMWVFEVQDFGPLTVAIDVHGGNLYREVRARVVENHSRVREEAAHLAEKLVEES